MEGGEPIIAVSARKHGVTDEDMLHAYRNPIRLFELDEGLTMNRCQQDRDGVRGRGGSRGCCAGDHSRDASTREILR